MQGQLYRDTKASKNILVDGILASLFYAYDRYRDKTVINATLARHFGFDELKNARSLLYQAFFLQDSNGKITDKRTEETLLRDLWEKIIKIDMNGHGDVIVVMPYNFNIPQFVSDEEFAADISRNTSSTMLLERMQTLEKKVEDKNNVMMNMLQSICTKMNSAAQGSSQPSFTHTYAGVAASTISRSQQRNTNLLNPPRGVQSRDRSPSVKRGNSESNQPEKKRRTEKYIVTGTRSNTSRKMKSPPADIFVYGVPRETTKEDIVEDLAESDIQITKDDILLMSKGNPSVMSYKISIKAEDLNKALDPTVWPMRVKVREFIYYRKKPDRKQVVPSIDRPISQLSSSRSDAAVRESGFNGATLNIGNTGRFHVLEDDVQI